MDIRGIGKFMEGLEMAISATVESKLNGLVVSARLWGGNLSREAFGEHTACAASGVAQRPDDSLLRENVAVRLKEKIDHEPDDFARSEVVTRSLVSGFVELADELLEDVAHLGVGHDVRVKVDVAEL